jgi:hypothetical protein
MAAWRTPHHSTVRAESFHGGVARTSGLPSHLSRSPHSPNPRLPSHLGSAAASCLHAPPPPRASTPPPPLAPSRRSSPRPTRSERPPRHSRTRSARPPPPSPAARSRSRAAPVRARAACAAESARAAAPRASPPLLSRASSVGVRAPRLVAGALALSRARRLVSSRVPSLAARCEKVRPGSDGSAFSFARSPSPSSPADDADGDVPDVRFRRAAVATGLDLAARAASSLLSRRRRVCAPRAASLPPTPPAPADPFADLSGFK